MTKEKEELSNNTFIRDEKIEPYFNGGLLVELKGGEKIEISRRQTVKFKEMMSF